MREIGRDSNTPRCLFKAAFEAPEHAAGLFRCVLPGSCADAMVWSTLSPEPGSFIDPALGNSHSDLLFSVDVGETRTYLYLLLEHQSSNHPDMPLRVLRYLERIWERHRKQDAVVTGREHCERFCASICAQVPETQEAAMTYGEELQAQGMQRGLKQGRIEMIEKQLTRKFGELPTEYRARVEAADLEQLDRYAMRILTAATLEDVFADPN